MSVEPLSFVPSRVEGLVGVTLVTIHADCIVFNLSNSTRTFLFRDIGRSVDPVISRIVDILRFRRPLRIIGERNWFHSPPDRFIRFYSDPWITVYMPIDDVREYGPSIFCRAQQVWRSGRVDTFDLG